MIGVNRFSNLDHFEKLDRTLNDGDFIISISNQFKVHSLHAYNGFFVEIIYSRPGMKVLEISNFIKSEKLEKYLDEIEIRIQ